jgi:hypothetical protein
VPSHSHIPLSPEERRRRLAALLATGLMRLGSTLRAPTSAPPSGPPDPSKNVSESLPNQLAESGTKSVTVSAG